jgi:hypothetical protein
MAAGNRFLIVLQTQINPRSWTSESRPQMNAKPQYFFAFHKQRHVLINLFVSPMQS